MKSATRSRDRIVLVGGLAICIGIWTVGRGLPRLLGWYADEQHQLQELQRRAALVQSAESATRTYTDSITARRQRLDNLEQRLFRAPTVSTGAAAAGSYVTDLAHSARVAIGSLEISSDSAPRNQLRTVKLRLSAKSDVAGLMHLLASVESNQKLLTVKSLSVSQSDIAGEPRAPEVLDIQLTIQALALEDDSR